MTLKVCFAGFFRVFSGCVRERFHPALSWRQQGSRLVLQLDRPGAADMSTRPE